MIIIGKLLRRNASAKSAICCSRHKQRRVSGRQHWTPKTAGKDLLMLRRGQKRSGGRRSLKSQMFFPWSSSSLTMTRSRCKLS